MGASSLFYLLKQKTLILKKRKSIWKVSSRC